MKSYSFLYEVSSRCNLNCSYCYHPEEARRAQNEMDFKSVQLLFERLTKEIQIDSITLMGGEPLLYSHLNSLIQFFNKKSISMGIATNGLLLNQNKISELIVKGVSSFEISLDSVIPETLRKLTGSSHLDHLKKTILEIKKKGIFLAVNCVLTKLNKNEMEDLICFCSAFSVDRLLLSFFIPGVLKTENQISLLLNGDESKRMLSGVNRFAEKYGQKIILGYAPPSCIINPDDYVNLQWSRCSCGDEKWLIDQNGNLKTCEFSKKILGNLLEQSFLELTQLTDVNEFRKRILKDECRFCEKKETCDGGCRFYSDMLN